jgi:hypothetical protein
MINALVTVLLLSSAAPTAADAPLVVVADDGEPDVLERYFPLVMDAPLASTVEDSRLFFFLGGCLPLGQVWLPLVGGMQTDDGYLVDALIIAAIHLFPHLALLILVAATPVAIIPVLGWIIVASIYLVNAINLIAFIANNFYFTPVALINEANRHAGDAGSKKSKTPSRRKKKNAALQLGRSSVAMSF